MTRLTWGALGERTYELGVDRGVLYPQIGDGVAWNGLVSVTESPTGAEATPYYQNGIRFLNVLSIEEFEATIEALSAPAEFRSADGSAALANGLFATQQPRKPFGLSYRTKVNTDTQADVHHKIHLVYNAYASPAERANTTITDVLEPLSLSWLITTIPEAIENQRPSAHLVIDTRVLDDVVIDAIEDVLYGAEGEEPRLPLPEELVSIITQ